MDARGQLSNPRTVFETLAEQGSRRAVEGEGGQGTVRPQGPGGTSLSARRKNGRAFEPRLRDKRPIEILEGPQISAIDARSLSLVLLGQPRSVVTR